MIKKSLFFICLICCIGICCYAQSESIEKLIAEFESEASDSVKLTICKDIIDNLITVDSAKAFHYIREGITLSNKLADDESSLFFESQKASVFIEYGHFEKANELLRSVGSKAEAKNYELVTLNCLEIQGKGYLYQGNIKKVSELLEKMLSIYKKRGEQRNIAYTLSNLGVIYVELGDLDKALGSLNESIPLMEQLNDEMGIAQNIKNLGVIHFTKGQFEKALQYYHRSLEIEEKINNKEGIAKCFYEISIAQVKLGNFDLATFFSKRSIELHKQLGENFFVIMSTAQIGTNYMHLGKYDLALKYLNDAINQAKAINNSNLVTNLSMDLGQLYLHQGNFDEGISYLTTTLDSIRDKGDKSKVLTLLNNIGYAYKVEGKIDSALNYFRKAIRLNDSSNLHIRAYTLTLMGFSFLEHLDNEDSAFYYLGLANQFYSQTNDEKSLRRNLERTGSWYTSQGNIPKALKFYDEALKIVEKASDSLGMAKIYESLAYVYETQQSLGEAIAYQEKALNIYDLTEDISRSSKAKIALAELYIKEDSYQQAIQLATDAQNNLLQLQDSCQLGNGYLVLGKAHASLNSRDSAVYYLEKSSYQARKCNHYVVAVQANIELGSIYQAANQQEKAFDFFKQALEAAKTSRDRKSINDAAAFLFPIYQQRGQYKDAFEILYLYQANKDSLFNKENTRKLVQKEMEIAYTKAEQEKALQQQKENALKNSQLERQQWIIYTSLGAFFAMSLIAIALYRNYRNKQKANILLRQQKKGLEELDHVKSRLFANLAHELRTPLTLISSPVQVLIKNKGEHTADTFEKLEMVNRNSQQLNGLVNDIMDLSKLESKKIELQEECVDIKALAGRIFSNFSSLAEHLRINYTIQLDDLTDEWVLLDGAKVEKVLNNLLSNAIKNTPSGGEVSFSVKQAKGNIKIHVADTGQGIAKADLPLIFDRFYQSKQPDAPIQGGTGIGLALAKELTNLMEGRLSVESELGKGSLFSLEIPYQVAEPPVSVELLLEEAEEQISLVHLEQTALSDDEKQFKILIVEDHPDMQQFVKGLLEMKYHVCLANNGRKALEVLHKEQIDLLVSDVMMPEMDGYELLKQLKESKDFNRVPVIMLTALDDEENKLSALTMGVDDYLTKPFSPQELLARTHNLLLRYQIRKELLLEDQPDHLIKAPQNEGQLVKVKSINGASKGVLTLEVDEEQIDTKWLREVANVIIQELENPHFQTADLATRFNASLRSFYRKIKINTGMSPKKYQQEIALLHARDLLQKKALGNVTAICYAIGMSNVSRFSQLFEARFGKKPKDYFMS